jgi:hypothetical protein
MRRVVLVVAGLVAIAVGIGPHMGSVGGGLPPAAAQEDQDSKVDARATRLVDRLGPFCGNFDFFYRHGFAGGQMRPVRCSRSGREKTILVVHSFSDRRTKKAWLAEWAQVEEQQGAVVIRGRKWTVEVLVHSAAPEVRKRL